MQLCPAMGESDLFQKSESCCFHSELNVEGRESLHYSSKSHCRQQTEAWVLSP